MAYAVEENGKFNGLVYPVIDDNVRRHHKSLGHKLVQISADLVNMGTEDAPDWQVEDDLTRVPHEVTMRQARLALRRAGYLSQVSPALTQLPEPMKTEAEIEWEYAQVIERGSSLVDAIGGLLGLTDKQLDDLFRSAELI